MSQLVECVPNYSEGRNSDVIKKIVAPFIRTEGVNLLDYSADKDHNRLVVTIMGRPDKVKEALIISAGEAIEAIDMRQHKGEHPRMGAIDVIPFIPIRNYSMEEAVELARSTAQEMAGKYNLPVYLYEKAATIPTRENLAAVRKGEFEGLDAKMATQEWQPDFGPSHRHPTAGATAVGARMPLIAYNINLATDKLEIAQAIAQSIRHISGGFRYCKAMGVALQERGIVQVSINMTDYTRTPLYRVFEVVKMEAARYGVQILGSEIIGLTPMEALINSAAYYLRLEEFTNQQIIENRIGE